MGAPVSDTGNFWPHFRLGKKATNIHDRWGNPGGPWAPGGAARTAFSNRRGAGNGFHPSTGGANAGAVNSAISGQDNALLGGHGKVGGHAGFGR